MTAPAPTVCPACGGEGEIDAEFVFGILSYPCPDCCCWSCGEPTDAPPICRDCEVQP